MLLKPAQNFQLATDTQGVASAVSSHSIITDLGNTQGIQASGPGARHTAKARQQWMGREGLPFRTSGCSFRVREGVGVTRFLCFQKAKCSHGGGIPDHALSKQAPRAVSFLSPLACSLAGSRQLCLIHHGRTQACHQPRAAQGPWWPEQGPLHWPLPGLGLLTRVERAHGAKSSCTPMVPWGLPHVLCPLCAWE